MTSKQVFVKTANEVYGETFVMVDSNYVVIHFPVLPITNSRGINHEILDLYVKFQFDGNKLLSRMLGMRATIIPDEYNLQYLHSHLGRDGIGIFKKFCVGAGSEMDRSLANASIASIHGSIAEKMLKFKFLLHYLPLFLKWESLEGVPYVKIENLGVRSDPSYYEYPLSGIIRWADRLIADFNSIGDKAIKLSYSIEYPFVRLIYNSHLEQVFQIFTEQRQPVDSLGNYITLRNTNGQLDNIGNPIKKNVFIADKNIECKVLLEENEQETEKQFEERVPEVFRQYFENKINYLLSNWAVKNFPATSKGSIVKRETKSITINGVTLESVTTV